MADAVAFRVELQRLELTQQLLTVNKLQNSHIIITYPFLVFITEMTSWWHNETFQQLITGHCAVTPLLIVSRIVCPLRFYLV